MKHRRLFFFRPLTTHAEGHLEVTTIVVVVIDRYLYDYYYLTGHSELPHGSRVRRNPVPQRARDSRDLGPNEFQKPAWPEPGIRLTAG